jgi:tetratricopeptide (TPR) repeat protein
MNLSKYGSKGQAALKGLQYKKAVLSVTQGNELFNEGHCQEAIECYDRAVDLDPYDYNAWYSRGIAYISLEKYSEAVESFECAIEINSGFYQAWYNYGVALSGLGRFTNAITIFDRALEINPNDGESWYSRGLVSDKAEKYNEALILDVQVFKLLLDD